MEQKRERFGSRMAVIFAMAGSAIGLGNIWRFPYMVGEHGGAAFILVYILATLVVSLPIFIAEVTLGRRSRTGADSAMSKLRPATRRWNLAGALAIFIPLLIVSYYSVIGGWSLDYLGKSLAGAFVRTDPENVPGLFDAFISSAWAPVLAHLLFLAACAAIVALGVKTGIEKFSKLSIPVLFVLIVAMCIYSVTLPGASAGVKYLLTPDFSQLTPRSLAYALGQSFFSLSLGMGAIVTYGSYVSGKENIVVSSAGTSLSDLLFALLAGMAIMPAVFAAGIEPGAGPGLIFQSVPYIFSSMGAESPVISAVVAVVFFLAVVMAAMTSCISLLEVGVSWLREKKGLARWKGCLLLFVVCGAVGVLCSLSFGPLSSFKIGGMGIFDLCDWTASNILLLILAFLTTVFVGHVLSRDEVRDEITNHGTANLCIFPLVYFLIKWVAPLFILLIFITNFIL
ncbi:MAG: sodium-dependent transporter [Bacteroidales bacterium]|nr:sodium-dependent transporter [Bacteroidales bacterium]